MVAAVGTSSSGCSPSSTTPSGPPRSRWSARAACTTSATCSTSTSPVFPGRYFQPDARHHRAPREPEGGVGENQVNWITELVSGTMQLGTHLDALSPPADRRTAATTAHGLRAGRPAGVRQLGIETVPQIVTRGWLVDVPARLGPGRRDHARRRARASTPTPGDAVLFHTGWGAALGRPRHLPLRRARPGLRARAVARRPRRRADRLRHVELRPGAARGSRAAVRRAADPQRPPRRLHRREPRHSSELAADGVRRFALILTHPKLRGATGAWTSPIALV